MLVLLLIGTCVSATEEEINQKFADFLITHRQEGYSSAAEAFHRYSVFRENYMLIEEMNSSQSKVELALNKFADLTQQEFADLYLKPRQKIEMTPIDYPSFTSPAPDSWDWTTLGGVTPVQTFYDGVDALILTIVKTVETLHFNRYKELVQLSMKQVQDCAQGFPNVGDFYSYIEENGLMSDRDYLEKDGECQYDKDKVTATITGWQIAGAYSQEIMMNYVFGGTLAVGVDASSPVWQFYHKGIIDGNCGKEVDHEVLLVGYGKESSTDFWKVQNNWGADWGEKGYARILRNGNSQQWGECGIAIQPYIPV